MEEHGENTKIDDDEDLDNYVYMDDDMEGGRLGGDNRCKGDDYDDDDDDDYDCGSDDGYDEDDDDDGSYDEIGWDEEEDEEYDTELERRIEAFIAKVINGWKEEWFSDNLIN